MSDFASEVEAEFKTAVAVARHALDQFNAEPLVPSKAGGPRTSPWWRTYREASELAVKWHRELRALAPPEYRVTDAELDRLLDGD